MTVRIIHGDCRDVLRTLPDESVHCVTTSPPYWGLRDYGVDGQIGLEASPAAYTETMVDIFREVRRVLRSDGTLWLNLGDSYATGAGRAFSPGGGEQGARYRAMGAQVPDNKNPGSNIPIYQPNRMPIAGLKPKDLVGIPWRVAFALQADGWWLRQDIVWSKPNPMPESVTDRCTKAHEYLFLLSKSERYYFDQEAILEPISANTHLRVSQETLAQQEGSDRVPGKTNGPMKAVVRKLALAGEGIKNNESMDAALVAPGRKSGNKQRKSASERGVPIGLNGTTNGAVAGSVPWEGYQRNKRSVWTVTTQPFSEAHFATFPPDLIEPCILAGCPERCCPHCGAPWLAAVERIDAGYNGSRYGERALAASGGAITGGTAKSTLGSSSGKLVGRRMVNGYTQNCACEVHDPVTGTILDPFFGAGTTGLVADRLGRDCIGIELNPDYAAMAERRLHKDAGMFASVVSG